MSFDALAALREAGTPVDSVKGPQQLVLAQLTEEEVAILISISKRLTAVGGGEVEGQDLNVIV